MGQTQMIISTFLISSLLITAWLYAYSINFCVNVTQLPQPKAHQQQGTPSAGLLTAHLHGGLGNQMFMYSALYALSKQSGRTPHACDTYNISGLFPNLSIPIHPLSHCVNGSDLLPRHAQRMIQAHDHHYFDLGLLRNIQNSKEKRIHNGYIFQNPSFFYEYFKELLKEFSLGYSHREIAYGYLNQQIAEYNKRNPGIKRGLVLQIVGVHVRRGDLLTTHPQYVEPPPTYFKNAMNYFRRRYQDRVLFVVSTDDLKWCHKNLNGTDIIFTSDSGLKTREEDFSIQVCCNHTIVSIGTFGWWMGFFSKGEVVAFSGWVGTSPWWSAGQYYPGKWRLM